MRGHLQHFPYFSDLNLALKQLLTILLLAIHLFNFGGYRLVFDQLEKHSGKTMVQRIDADAYHDQDLVEVRVPINLPYQTSWKEFERYDGEIYMNGVHYNYVKRKIQNDTLILLCLPNTEKTRLMNARETFFSLVNDLQDQQPSKSTPVPAKSVKFSQVECLLSQAPLIAPIPAPSPSTTVVFNTPALRELSVLSPEQPPDTRLG